MAMFFIISATHLSLFADISQGETLERQMWADVKSHNWNAVEEHIAADFQSVHADGPRTRDQELTLLKDMNISNYILSNFKVTQNQGVLVVTYTVAVKETIDSRNLANKPYPRLSVWQMNNNVWQWIAHANLHPIQNAH